jgi:hypothetical protein
MKKTARILIAVGFAIAATVAAVMVASNQKEITCPPWIEDC